MPKSSILKSKTPSIIFILVILFVVFFVIIYKITSLFFFFSCPKEYFVLFPPLSVRPSLLQKLDDWYIKKFCPETHIEGIGSIAFAESFNSDLANLKNISSTLISAYDKINIFNAWDFVRGKINF